MEITTQYRNDIPQQIEYIGLGFWHYRWNIQEQSGTDEEENEYTYYSYYEVKLDHEPTDEEITEIESNV